MRQQMASRSVSRQEVLLVVILSRCSSINGRNDLMRKLFSFLLLISSSFAFAQSYVPEKTNSKVKVNPVAHVSAYAFNLKDVKLLNNPFRHAMQMDSAYLLLLKPDRLLYRFHKFAGLQPKD